MIRTDRVVSDRRADAAELVTRLEPLLSPDRSQVTGWRGRRSGGLSWIVVPSLQKPLVLLPPTVPAASLLLRSSGTGKPSTHLRLLALLQRRGWLARLPLPTLSVQHSGPSPHLLVALQVVFPQVTDVAIRLGRPRHNRPWILLAITAAGDVAAVVKVAAGEARAALEREYANLARVEAASVPELRSPKPLGYWRVGDLDLLAMEHLLSTEPQNPRPVPVEVMRSLAQLDGVARRRLADVSYVGSLRERAHELADRQGQRWLSAALDRLLDELGDVELPWGIWHGDWVPWNMARRSEQVLLWDWEHLDDDVPLGWDHAHYLAQDLRGRAGVDDTVEQRWLHEATEALQQEWGLDSRQARACLLLYLLEINLRFLLDRLHEGQAVGARRGWSRTLIESLLPDREVAARAGGESG